MSAGHAPTPQTVTAHYSQHQQPPLLQPGPGTYSPSQNSYQYGGYSNGMTSPQSGSHQVPAPLAASQMNTQILPLPGKQSFLPYLRISKNTNPTISHGSRCTTS